MLERTQTLEEEFANTLTHGMGLLLSIIGLLLLIDTTLSTGDIWKVLTASVFGMSLITLYMASTCYHSCHSIERKHKFKVWDHCSIYLLIAGSYTPFTLITLEGTLGWTLFCIIWGLALTGIAFKLLFVNRFNILFTCLYVLMGWLVVVAVEPMAAGLPSEALLLVFMGGIFYSVGVIFYIWERPRFNHAIWHLFVLGGSVCHYMAIYSYVL